MSPDVILECLELASHAPNADNQQNWRWLVITDPEMKTAVAETYRRAWRGYRYGALAARRRRRSPEQRAADERNLSSASWLADILDRVPVLVIPCMMGQPPTDEQFAAMDRSWSLWEGGKSRYTMLSLFYGSIFPAVWSFALALRSRGLGSVFTCMHLSHGHQLRETLGLPTRVTQIGMLPVAYTIGLDFKPARRAPIETYTYWNRWEQMDHD